MPASLRDFDERPLPRMVVVDSSFLFEALIDPLTGDGRHEACAEFANALRLAQTVLVYSPLLFVEATQCWRRLYRDGSLTPSIDTVDDTTTRVVAFQEASGRLEEFLTGFETYEIPANRNLIDETNRAAALYNLNSHDAVHVAICISTQVNTLVAIDRDFRRVDGIELWSLS